MASDENGDLSDYVYIQNSDMQIDRAEHMRTVRELKEWLEKTDSDSPASEYRKHLHSHARGTGEWILETTQYKQWSQSNNFKNLWIRGIPGCGKSVVAASLINRLRRQGDAIVLFFFFREVIQMNRSPRSLIQDFCHELVDHSPPLVESLKSLKEVHSNVASLPFEKLWSSLANCLGSIKERVFCVVDALDEMKRGNESDQFLEEFLNLQTPETVKVILTSRQVPQVERYMSGACLVDLRLDRKNVDRDIAFYLTQRLENSEMDIPVETAEILKKAICDRGKGLFLYARLMFDKLLLHPDDILSQIDSLPDGLGDMYGDILHEHVARSGTNSHFQRLILEWIIHSSRPMRLLELAVMVDALPDRGHLDPSIDAKMGIRTTCGPLLEVCEDGVVQIIHHSLTEFALNRDVSHTRMSQQKREFSVLDSASVHEMIALTCLRYLENIANKEQTSLHGMTSRQRKDMYLRHYFLQYAVSEWPFHAVNGPESNENLLDCLIKFFQPGNLALKFWEGLRREEWNRSHPGRWDRDCKDDVPPLFIAAHYGITFLTRHFLKNGVSPDVYDSHRLTPLVYAIERGHNEIIELLLQHQASHDVGCAEKGKPVHFAAERNNTQALQNLIVAGADMAAEKIVSDINQTYDHRNERYETSQSRDTPFLIACRQGHVETIDLLINHCQQSHLFKGLHIAILEGQLKVIEALLRVQDVRSMINDRDCNGNTALYMASKKRRSDLVECLLNSGADVNALSMNLNSPPEPPSSSPMSRKVLPSYTPVHGWAIGPQFLRTSKFKSWDNRNHPIEESVLQSLLSAGCDINAKDHRGRSALFFWSEFCSYSAQDPIIPLQVLIKQGADASILDRTGASLLHMKGTPLTLEILQLLVDSGLDINVSRCTDGATPLMLAAGSKETDPFIFQAVNADFHRQDLAGNTALFYYLRKSRRESLLQLENWIKLSNVNIQNNFGKTPFLEFLHYNGDSDEKLVEIFKKMVQQGMSIHTRDFTGKNALLTGLSHWKHYWKSGQNLIEELLSMGLNVQETDDEGKSALHWIAKHYSHFYGGYQSSIDFANLLVAAGADPNALDRDGNSILHDLWQNETEWNLKKLEDRARALIDHGCPINIKNRQGRTILHVAVAIEDCGWERDMHGYQIADLMTRVEFLLQPPIQCDLNAKDRAGITPLHLAAAISDVNASILVNAGADVRAKDFQGRTPLHFAAEAGQSNALGFLIEIYEESSFDIDYRTLKGRTALHYACRSGVAECVQLLLNAGANVNIADERHRTPLHAAAEVEYELDARKLERTYDSTPSHVEKSPDPYQKRQRKDAIQKLKHVVENEASNKSIRRVVQLLLAAGADSTSVDEDGHYPIDVATMLGCADIVDELGYHTSSQNPTAFDPSLGILLALSESSPEAAAESISLPEDHEQFLKRLLSTGNRSLIGRLLASKRLRLTGDEGKSALGLAARSGWTSVMMQLLPHVGDLPELLPFLIKNATDRELCNISMIKYLAEFVPDVLDKECFTNSLNTLARGSRWWHSHGLSTLLQAGAAPNGPEDRYSHEQPLHSSLFARHTCCWRDSTTKILLEFGADPKSVTKSVHENSPLNIAISRERSIEIIDLLIKKGSSLSEDSVSGPPLISAVSSKRDDVLEYLLKAGANPNGTSKHNPLVSALDPKASDAALSILIQYGANPLCPIYDNTSTVFHEICRANQCVQRLVSTGLDLNARDGKGCTPLMKACMNVPKKGQESAVLTLVNMGVDVQAVDYSGSTALHHAIRSRYLEAVQAILSHDARITHCNHEGYTALRCALEEYEKESEVAEQDCGSGNVDNSSAICHAIVSALLDAGANALEIFPDGRTALHYASVPLMDYSNIDRAFQIEEDQGPDHFTDALNLYNRFLSAGCDPAARNNKGETALFTFVKAPKSYHGSWCDNMPDRYANPEDCARMATLHGLQEVDNEGNTPLHAIASREWNYEGEDYEANLFEIFVDLGLSPWKENMNGLTALDVAATYEKQEILALFARDD